MIPHDLHYAFPPAAYLLPLVVLFFILYWRLFVFRRSIWQNFGSSTILASVLTQRSFYNFWAKTAALSAAWVLAIFALMQPRGNGHYPTLLEVEQKRPEDDAKEAVARRKAHDVIFLIDASASMNVKDTRLGGSRLDDAKEIADEIISRLKGESVALWAFTSETTRLSPLTHDYLFVRLMLRQLNINEGDIAGTNLLEALADMREQYFSIFTPKHKTVIVLTDAGDTQLEEKTGEKRQELINALRHVIRDADAHQLRLFTIGLGTKQGGQIPNVMFKGQPVVSRLDEELLKALSRQGRGGYYFANDWTAMDLAKDVIAKMGKEEPPLEKYHVVGEVREQEHLVYDLFYQIPLGVAMVLLGFVIFFPDTRVRKEKQ
ncbi:MAG: vWA domain-containing protein [Waddliaceae bacterium]